MYKQHTDNDHAKAEFSQAPTPAARSNAAALQTIPPQKTPAIVIQRFPSATSKATQAVLHTRKHVKAGNQRGEVIATSGHSQEALGNLRSADLTPLLRSLKEILSHSVIPSIRKAALVDEGHINTYIDAITPFVTGALSEMLGSGNCGEFADVVYRYLVETSGPQLQVYSCFFTTEDHAFNLVYNAGSPETPLFPDAASMAAHVDEIRVADAWGNIIDSLTNYLGGRNPYGHAFNLDEIAVNHKHQGLDLPIFSADAILKIRQFAAEIRSQYSRKDAAHLTQGAILDLPIAGLYESEDLAVPQTLSALRIIELLQERISGRNKLLHAITLPQRKAVFALMERFPELNDLYERCKDFYSPTDWNDIIH